MSRRLHYGAVLLIGLLGACGGPPSPESVASTFADAFNAHRTDELVAVVAQVSDGQRATLETAMTSCAIDEDSIKVLADATDVNLRFVVASARCHGTTTLLAAHMQLQQDGSESDGWRIDGRDLPGGPSAEYSYPQIPPELRDVPRMPGSR